MGTRSGAQRRDTPSATARASRLPRTGGPGEHALDEQGPDLDGHHTPGRLTAAERDTLDIIIHTEELMAAIADTEEAIAHTLKELSATREGENSQRQLRLAEEATAGARTAAERAESLRRLAHDWSDHAGLAELRRLVTHATSVLADLASTQRAITDTLASLGYGDEPGSAPGWHARADGGH
jgi:hypothetical protein